MNRLLPVAALLVLCFASGCATTFDSVTRKVSRTSDFFAGKRPNTFVRMMEDKSSPDARRVGINRLVEYDFAQKAPYTDRYRQIAASDPDDLVRATAIRALNRSRDKTSIDLYITALKDPNDLVRLEGAKALIHMPDPRSAEQLTAIVNRPDENRDVRIAAAEALKHYATIEVARVLVGKLNEREFGVAYQARRSLKRMTKKRSGLRPRRVVVIHHRPNEAVRLICSVASCPSIRPCLLTKPLQPNLTTEPRGNLGVKSLNTPGNPEYRIRLIPPTSLTMG